MSGPEIESTLASKIEDPKSWALTPRAEAFFNRPSKQYSFTAPNGDVLSIPSSVNQTLKNTVGSFFGEGYTKKLAENTTGRLGDAFGGARGDFVRGTGEVTRKALPFAIGGNMLKDVLFGGGIKDENEKKAIVAKTLAENADVESEFKALVSNFKDSDTGDQNFYLTQGSMAKVPEQVQDAVWDDVVASADGTKRVTSIYRKPASEVMNNYRTSYETKGKGLEWKAATGRVDKSQKPIEDTIPQTKEMFESGDARVISTPYTLDPSDGKFGIKAKDGNRYIGVIVDVGMKAIEATTKKKEEAKNIANANDPKKNNVAKGPKTLDSLIQEEEESPAGTTERFKWAFFRTDDPKLKGMKALYRVDGKLATPEF
jgi:hypothetical protein